MKIKGNKVWDEVRGCWLVLTPEEWVRQHFIKYLIGKLHVEPHRIGREVLLPSGKRADIVVYNTKGEPSLIVECKAQNQPINQSTLEQVAGYNITMGVVPYLAVTNGKELHCFEYDNESKSYRSIPELPMV